MDEALKKGIRIDTNLLSQKLGIPVVRTSARTQMGLTELTEAVQAVSRSSSKKVLLPPVPPRVEPLVQTLEQAIAPLLPDGMRSRWAALQLLCRNEDFIRQLDSILETPLLENPTVAAAFSSVEQQLNQSRKHPPCCWMSCLPHWFAAASSCVMPVFLFRPPPIFRPTEYRTTVRPTGWTDCFSAAGPASL